MARDIGRVSGAWSTGLSLLAALGFFAAARLVGEAPPMAVVGGTVWVFILAMIVSMPLVAAWTRRRDSKTQDAGGAS